MKNPTQSKAVTNDREKLSQRQAELPDPQVPDLPTQVTPATDPQDNEIVEIDFSQKVHSLRRLLGGVTGGAALAGFYIVYSTSFEHIRLSSDEFHWRIEVCARMRAPISVSAMRYEFAAYVGELITHAVVAIATVLCLYQLLRVAERLILPPSLLNPSFIDVLRTLIGVRSPAKEAQRTGNGLIDTVKAVVNAPKDGAKVERQEP
ncbi:MAG: hypothetical protein U0325_19730 [Polyangiales bacterium]